MVTFCDRSAAQAAVPERGRPVRTIFLFETLFFRNTALILRLSRENTFSEVSMKHPALHPPLGLHSRGYLPHREIGTGVQGITFHSHEANRMLNRQGQFWQEEYHDRYIRDEQHLECSVRYIEMNPVKAGLCRSPEDWPFSSAWRRKEGRMPKVLLRG
jgi:hypothetical protein